MHRAPRAGLSDSAVPRSAARATFSNYLVTWWTLLGRTGQQLARACVAVDGATSASDSYGFSLHAVHWLVATAPFRDIPHHEIRQWYQHTVVVEKGAATRGRRVLGLFCVLPARSALEQPLAWSRAWRVGSSATRQSALFSLRRVPVRRSSASATLIQMNNVTQHGLAHRLRAHKRTPVSRRETERRRGAE